MKVIDGIHALGRAAQRNGFKGPALGIFSRSCSRAGAKEAAPAPRHFDEETMRAGETIVPSQAGEPRAGYVAHMLNISCTPNLNYSFKFLKSIMSVWTNDVDVVVIDSPRRVHGRRLAARHELRSRATNCEAKLM